MLLNAAVILFGGMDLEGSVRRAAVALMAGMINTYNKKYFVVTVIISMIQKHHRERERTTTDNKINNKWKVFR
jgi:hypothetical protein